MTLFQISKLALNVGIKNQKPAYCESKQSYLKVCLLAVDFSEFAVE